MSAQEVTSSIKPFLFVNHHSDLRMVRFSGSTEESANQVLLHGIKVCEIWDQYIQAQDQESHRWDHESKPKSRITHFLIRIRSSLQLAALVTVPFNYWKEQMYSVGLSG